MKRRIAFAGAGGTGKTTLGAALEKTTGLVMDNVSTSDIMQKWNIPMHRDAVAVASAVPSLGIGFQTDIVTKRFNHFQGRHGRDEEFLTDRTPLDCLAYYLVHNAFWDSEEHTQQQYDLVRESAEFYSHVFFLPNNVFPVELGHVDRPLNPYYHEMIGTLIRHLGNALGYNLIVIPHQVASVEDRVAFVMDRIK